MGFCGKLLRNGRVVLDDVSGAVQVVRRPDGQPSRSGYFQTEPTLPLSCGDELELQLEDGQILLISITSLVPPKHPAVARFVELPPP